MTAWLGIFIGFYGYLFPGNIAIMVMQFYAEKKYQFLILVLALILIFESIYCYFTLYSIELLLANHRVFFWVQMVAIVISAALGLWMMLEKGQDEKVAANNVRRGLFSIFIHPQQIAYWVFIYVFFTGYMTGIFKQNALPYFVLFNAIGTFFIMVFYIFIGTKLVRFFKLNQRTMNRVVGMLFLLFSLKSLWGLF